MDIRIYHHDTDCGGVVYYGNYLKYLEEARTEFLEARGLSVREFMARGLFYAVHSCHIVYKSPARYGDVLICDARLTGLTAVRLMFEQTVTQKNSGRTVAEATVTLACLNRDMKPCPLPSALKECLK